MLRKINYFLKIEICALKIEQNLIMNFDIKKKMIIRLTRFWLWKKCDLIKIYSSRTIKGNVTQPHIFLFRMKRWNIKIQCQYYALKQVFIHIWRCKRFKKSFRCKERTFYIDSNFDWKKLCTSKTFSWCKIMNKNKYFINWN